MENPIVDIDIQYPYALDESGNLVFIEDAKKGQYSCSSCGAPMIPRLGDIRQHHFAHKVTTSTCSFETWLHRNSKLLLQKLFHEHSFPKIYYRCPTCKYKFLFNTEGITDLCVENYAGGVKPDISLFRDGKLWAVIEVVVSHDIEKATLQKYKDDGIFVLVWKPELRDIQNTLVEITMANTHNFSQRCENCPPIYSYPQPIYAPSSRAMAPTIYEYLSLEKIGFPNYRLYSGCSLDGHCSRSHYWRDSKYKGEVCHPCIWLVKP